MEEILVMMQLAVPSAPAVSTLTFHPRLSSILSPAGIVSLETSGCLPQAQQVQQILGQNALLALWIFFYSNNNQKYFLLCSNF